MIHRSRPLREGNQNGFGTRVSGRCTCRAGGDDGIECAEKDGGQRLENGEWIRTRAEHGWLGLAASEDQGTRGYNAAFSAFIMFSWNVEEIH